MHDFDEFLSECNLKYTNEYYEKYKNGFFNGLKLFNSTYNPNDDAGLLKIYELEKLSSSILVNLSNEFALNHLKSYHEWLTANFDLIPKNTK